jgi:tRNA pseudouridine38-40 synthase
MTDIAETGMEPQNWKVTLAYDGSDFSGWQVQPGEVTVQGELQSAIRRVTGEDPLPQGSGRTDAGVHALGQVASFRLHAPIPAGNLCRAVNRTLPAAIRVLSAEAVAPEFHARHSATAKTYEYRIFREALCPPFLARYVLACRWPMDVGKMQAAARQLEGEHDFISFAATDPDLTARSSDNGSMDDTNSEPAVKSTIRTIFSSNWSVEPSPAGELLVYRVRGSGFLHHMVRNLVGTLMDVGRGRIEADRIAEILAARSRSAAGPTAPAHGLFLHSVEYGERQAARRTDSTASEAC